MRALVVAAFVLLAVAAPAHAQFQSATVTGVDVLKLGDVSAERRVPVSAADLLKGRRVGVPSARWGFACPLAL